MIVLNEMRVIVLIKMEHFLHGCKDDVGNGFFVFGFACVETKVFFF